MAFQNSRLRNRAGWFMSHKAAINAATQRARLLKIRYRVFKDIGSSSAEIGFAWCVKPVDIADASTY